MISTVFYGFRHLCISNYRSSVVGNKYACRCLPLVLCTVLYLQAEALSRYSTVLRFQLMLTSYHKIHRVQIANVHF